MPCFARTALRFFQRTHSAAASSDYMPHIAMDITWKYVEL
jgi:hypothetical protein